MPDHPVAATTLLRELTVVCSVFRTSLGQYSIHSGSHVRPLDAKRYRPGCLEESSRFAIRTLRGILSHGGHEGGPPEHSRVNAPSTYLRNGLRGPSCSRLGRQP